MGENNTMKRETKEPEYNIVHVNVNEINEIKEVKVSPGIELIIPGIPFYGLKA